MLSWDEFETETKPKVAAPIVEAELMGATKQPETSTAASDETAPNPEAFIADEDALLRAQKALEALNIA